MHLTLLLHVAVAALLYAPRVNADTCSVIQGNQYCHAVPWFEYTNVGSDGTYQEVTNMGSDGTCSTRPKHFGGPLAPFNEELSLHFRGPLNLRQLAVYNLVGSQKRQDNPGGRGHQHADNGLKLKEKNEAPEQSQHRSVQVVTTTIVTTTIVATPRMFTTTLNGKLVSWIENTCGEPTSASPPAVESSASPLRSSDSAHEPAVSTQDQHASPAPQVTPALPASVHGNGGDFKRIAYYDTNTHTADNLVFLGNRGGDGSGVFDFNWGSSLAYSNSKGSGGASGPEILDDVVIRSANEVIVMLNKKCENGDCGYTRPGGVAYHGFGETVKIFMIEFFMPHDGATGFLADQPAIWMLNAHIPLTRQYGDCSCWKSGCGELDIAEALHSGSEFLTSTLHSQHPAGSANYFNRPTTKTMKLAVTFNGDASTIAIVILPDDTPFGPGFAAKHIEKLMNSPSAKRVSPRADIL
ncbi:uncharacterized protein BP5553_02472 [Venustampulla echinocandica]|uniref:glucan endo-1,3-beta-D-glucosidase n=1 Tax=Venustampulla echinocandica TaxID=2656787 RepID=A0A370U424_9HELO|nr:uncharacterized protein BP5553_02472 [Venustampulla echinocandica]RDL42493.1 hypothetical protein BP5553_02472 [Venustampulla echinocandica]